MTGYSEQSTDNCGDDEAAGDYWYFDLVPHKRTPAVKWSDRDTWRRAPAPEGAWHGIPTGEANGVWVLDLDRKNGKDGLARILEALPEGLPETFTVNTVSGGLHLYFSYNPADPVGNRVGVLPGVDVRGQGGFVVGPGTPGYEAANDLPVATAPEALMVLVRRPAGASGPAVVATAIDASHPDWQYRLGKAAQYLADAPPCVEGQGGDTQLWLVCLTLSRTYELPIAKSLELLAPYNARCTPPWSVAALARKLEEAALKGHTITGTFSPSFAAPALPQAPPPPGTPALPVTVWRQIRNANHEYSFDLAAQVAGGSQTAAPYSQRELVAALTGPSAAPDWVGVWQYDEFRRRLLAVNPPLQLDAEVSGLTETDLVKIQAWYSCHGLRATGPNIRSAILVAADAAKYHPIRDYLDSLPRVSVAAARAYFDGIAGRLWGANAERVELESNYLRLFGVAAVRRVTRPGYFDGPDGRRHQRGPGTKVDNMLILTGMQGRNKSRFCAHLFGQEFFLDQMPELGSKEASIALEGIWCVEMAEMVAFSRAQEAVKKEFLARCEDKYRPHYERGTIIAKRQTVFVGTTNEDDFLRDPTGARRYWVCEIGTNPIDLTFSRDEFWAAAVALESAGDLHWIEKVEDGPGDEKSAGTSQSRHEAEDSWTEEVLRYTRDHRKAEGWVSAKQALTYGVPIAVDKQDDRLLARVKSILRRHLGPSSVQWIDGRAQRIYQVK